MACCRAHRGVTTSCASHPTSAATLLSIGVIDAAALALFCSALSLHACLRVLDMPKSSLPAHRILALPNLLHPCACLPRLDVLKLSSLPAPRILAELPRSLSEVAMRSDSGNAHQHGHNNEGQSNDSSVNFNADSLDH